MKNKGGRPTVINDIVIGKLEEIFSLDGTVLEACFYAGISKDAYYDYLTKHPEFSDRIEALRQQPVLLARRTVARELKYNYANAMDYLSRKAKKEFSQRQELTGAEGEQLIRPTISPEEQERLLALITPKKKA